SWRAGPLLLPRTPAHCAPPAARAVAAASGRLCNEPSAVDSCGVRQAQRSGQGAAHAANGLSDPLLVLDEREADVAFPVRTEAAARADGDVPVAQEAQGELLRGLRRGDSRPHEHRGARSRHVPADAHEPGAQRVTAPAVDLRNLWRTLTRVAQRDRRGDLKRLEGSVVEIRLQPGQRTDDVRAAE